MKRKTLFVSILIIVLFVALSVMTFGLTVSLPGEKNCNTDSDCTFAIKTCYNPCGSAGWPVNKGAAFLIDGINTIRCWPKIFTGEPQAFCAIALPTVPKPICQNNNCITLSTPDCPAICRLYSSSKDDFRLNESAKIFNMTFDEMIKQCNC